MSAGCAGTILTVVAEVLLGRRGCSKQGVVWLQVHIKAKQLPAVRAVMREMHSHCVKLGPVTVCQLLKSCELEDTPAKAKAAAVAVWKLVLVTQVRPPRHTCCRPATAQAVDAMRKFGGTLESMCALTCSRSGRLAQPRWRPQVLRVHRACLISQSGVVLAACFDADLRTAVAGCAGARAALH